MIWAAQKKMYIVNHTFMEVKEGQRIIALSKFRDVCKFGVFLKYHWKNITKIS